MKKLLVVGIIALFIVSAVSPMVIGYNAVNSERDAFLDNLAFYCLDASGSNAKYEYYKEQLLKDYTDNDREIVEDKVTQPVESPQTSVSSGPMDSPWSLQSHDFRHTGQSPYSTAHITGLEKWRFSPGDAVESSPVIDKNGTIYFGSDYFGGHLYAMYPNGTLKWKYDINGTIESAPAIDENGVVYVGLSYPWDGLYAIYPNGTKKWRYNSGLILSSPAIGEDGTIYFGTQDSHDPTGSLYAINPNGTMKWRFRINHVIYSSPAIGDDGTVYFGSHDTYVYALYPNNGTMKWKFKTGDWVRGFPSIAEDGTIYISSFDDYLYALNPNGTMKWRHYTNLGTVASAAIDEEGNIYIATNKLRVINPNGTLKWSFNYLPEDWWCGCASSPAISSEGIIYIGLHIDDYSAYGSAIIAINPNGTKRWHKIFTRAVFSGMFSSPAIAEDGTLYICSDQVWRGYLHAFGPVESNSPPGAPSITGTINGAVGEDYWYNFRAHDPDKNPIELFVDWGDGNSGWYGWYASDEKMWAEHKWTEKGTYNISAKVKDVLGEESDWGYLEVTMPMNQQTHNSWFLQFLQNHPRMFPMLRLLFDLN